MELKGKNALVTGAAHRVGKVIALHLAQVGCNIALHHHASIEAANLTLTQARNLSVKAESYQADLRSPHEIAELFKSVENDFQQLDFLVNSAAVMQRVPFMDVTPEDWQATVDLNLRAIFLCTQAAVRLMGKTGGVIINISDIAGLRPWPDFPVHSISKAGVEMLTKVAALALGPTVRVNAVVPGPVLKPERMSDERWMQIGRELPLGMPGRPEDVAEAVLFLLKNEFISGETLVVDGGNQLI